MASIPVTVIKMAQKSHSSINLPLPSAGANFKEGWQSRDADKCTQLKNLIPSEKRLEPSGRFVPLSDVMLWENSFHGITHRPYSGKMIIHAGNRIYCFAQGDESALILYEGVPDSHGMFCEFASKLYFYCDTHVYSIDRNFNVTEELPKAPVIINSVSQEHGTLGKKVNDPDYNLIAPRVGISYSASQGSSFVLPSLYKCDTNRPVKVYADGVEVKVSKVTESKVSVPDIIKFEEAVVEIYLKNPENISFDDFISYCTEGVSFGGSDVGGTRIIACSPHFGERRGEYCTSALADPLYFPKTTIEKLGDGCDRITGFAKSDGCLMIFTDRSVYKTEYTLTTEGGLFSTRQISDSIGCDMPGSICLAGNNIVFANSERGVFTVDRNDDMGVYNVFPVSSVINDGVNGLLSCSSGELMNANSLDFDGRYMLCVGDKIYIWDYSRCGLIRSADFEKSAGRMIWYMLECGMGQTLFSIGRELYGLEEEGGIISRYTKSEDVLCTSDNEEYLISTEEYDFGSPMEKKLVTEMGIKLKIPKNGKVRLSLLCDGEVYFTTSLMSATGRKTLFYITPPLVPFYGFSYTLQSFGTPFEVWGASVKTRKAE